MSLHYLLDGYNIIHQMPLQDNLTLEDQRQYLIRSVELRRPQGSLQNKVTVVFDGKHGVYGGHKSSEVQILFSQDESADELIKRMVEKAKNKKVICVVTDDKDIRIMVKSCGADVLSAGEFVARLGAGGSKKPRKLSDKASESLKSISSSAEYKINKEFKNIWVDKNKIKED